MKMLLISKELWAATKETKGNDEDCQKALAIMGLQVIDFHLQRVVSANSAGSYETLSKQPTKSITLPGVYR